MSDLPVRISPRAMEDLKAYREAVAAQFGGMDLSIREAVELAVRQARYHAIEGVGANDPGKRAKGRTWTFPFDDWISDARRPRGRPPKKAKP